MNRTTKSCSTYLSQKLPQFLHTVSRMLCPLDLSPAPEYCVQSVLTGCRHSIQMGMTAFCERGRLQLQSCGFSRVEQGPNRLCRRPGTVSAGSLEVAGCVNWELSCHWTAASKIWASKGLMVRFGGYNFVLNSYLGT